ncbi:PIG-L deacetylase family protein [Streptomyces bohaiensis]|uniref:PIG-L family deacetylase n=2 Tax=Streptomyces bohaiensis TaxID=1431344 RepID=A0ABX1CDK9_9ACTN|nr:PIG-L family deacetylase [Streptomyces bohaiensis]NJQ15865.1 PIG-L family deacetylase [Streptomyces bohaiensis]
MTQPTEAAAEPAETPASGPGTLLLSPHFDDAALSVAGLLPRLPGPVTVLTVHAGPPPADAAVSWWDASCGFTSAAEAHGVRDAEDSRACDLLGVARRTLGHPDGPYGGDPGLPELVAALAALPAGTTVLLPLGTNQPDHRAVREVALRALADRTDLTLLVYADLPYTGHLPGWGGERTDEALAASETWGEAFRELRGRFRTEVAHAARLDPAAWARKRAAVLCHGSQLAPLALDHGAFLAADGPLTAERVWSLTPGPGVG